MKIFFFCLSVIIVSVLFSLYCKKKIVTEENENLISNYVVFYFIAKITSDFLLIFTFVRFIIFILK